MLDCANLGWADMACTHPALTSKLLQNSKRSTTLKKHCHLTRLGPSAREGTRRILIVQRAVRRARLESAEGLWEEILGSLGDAKGGLGGSWGGSWGVSKALGQLLGSSWEGLGSSWEGLGGSWEGLGAILEGSWEVLGAS